MPQEEAEKVVETTSVEEVAEPQTSETSETEAEVNDVDFENDTNDAEVEKTKQTKEENAKFAKERREKAQKEKAEKEAKEQKELELQKLRYDTIKDTLGGINPYTKEKIEDNYDVEEYLTMKEMEKQGLDPVQDYASYIKQKQRTDNQKKIEQAQKVDKEQWIKNDRQEFVDKYPDVDLNSLINDPMFEKFAYGKVGNIPMASIYEDYQSLMNEVNKKAKDNAARMIANRQSSAGALNSETTETTYYTFEQLKNLSKEEVRRNYDKVIESEKRLRGLK